MGLELNPVIGVVEIANFLVNILLAFLVIRIGWRFTNIRAAKDLVLEEGRRSLDVCDKIRKDLRNFADSETLQQSNLIEHLDDLGNNINNCKKMFSGFHNRSNLQLSKDLDEDYETLRIKISGGRSWDDLNTDTANTWVRKVEDRIIDMMVYVNS